MQSSNKELVQRFYRDIIGNRNLDLAHQLIAEDYIQHNPMLPTGRAGVIAAVQYLRQFPPETPPEPPLKRMIAEGDFVVTHLGVSFAGQQQMVIDIFRLANAQLVEHWDAIQIVNGGDLSTLMAGPQEIKDLASTQANKAIIAAHCQKLVEEGQYAQTHRIIGEGNFVLAQSSGKQGGIDHVFYDLYCLDQGQILRHWPVQQQIPDQMAHANGMI